MPGKVIMIDCRQIADWDSLHAVLADRLGFPAWCGRNMNAWVDCLTYIDDPSGALSTVTVSPGSVLVLQLDHVKDFRARLPQVYEALVDCSAFVNWRRIEQDEGPVLSLSFYE